MSSQPPPDPASTSLRPSQQTPQQAAAQPVLGLQVITTVGSEADAQRIAEALIQQRLAACVQVDPAVRSYYRWEGRLAVDTEWRLVIKTTRGRWDAVQQAIDQLHPYELPELVATPIAVGSDAYLAWVAQQVETDQPAS